MVVVAAAQLLRVCAHHRKVDGSNLHMWNFFKEAMLVYIFSHQEKDFFDNDCRCLT